MPLDNSSPDLFKPRTYTPSMLNEQVRRVLTDHFSTVQVEGEISNLARPASGHWYFTLKDDKAQIRCAMFKSSNHRVAFKPVAGDKVEVSAKVSLYAPRGDYQLIVERMSATGEGELQYQFQQLKAKLDKEGLFDPAIKKPLPALPTRLGIITSANGAAIRDVLHVLSRRFPLIDVEVLPVPVQGTASPPAIVTMLEKANKAKRHDILLLTRGGGSLEDLAGFNDEAVARAIHASTIPVMSAIGHEVDFTISDFVADRRAPTPSAAAELLVPDQDDIRRHLNQLRRAMKDTITYRSHSLSQKLDHLHTRLEMHSPQQQLQHHRERLRTLSHRLVHHTQTQTHARQQHTQALLARLRSQHPQRQLAHQKQQLTVLKKRLIQSAQKHHNDQRQQLQQLVRALRAISPLATLERGYAIIRDNAQQVISRASAIKPGEDFSVYFADGEIKAKRINTTEPD